MHGNERTTSDIAIPVATSVSFICRGVAIPENEFKWKKANFKTSEFHNVEQSNFVSISRKDGESMITLTEVSFDKSGIYQCGTDIHSAFVNLHVYGSTF